jgi:hypothetical protein
LSATSEAACNKAIDKVTHMAWGDGKKENSCIYMNEHPYEVNFSSLLSFIEYKQDEKCATNRNSYTRRHIQKKMKRMEKEADI